MINKRINYLRKEIVLFERRIENKSADESYDKGYLCKLENELNWLQKLKYFLKQEKSKSLKLFSTVLINELLGDEDNDK